MAKRAEQFVRESFPKGATIRPDDVAKALVPVLEVDKDFVDFLSVNRLRQKYWFRDFADYILDREFAKRQAASKKGA